MTAKAQVLKAIQELPKDASIEDAMEKLYLIYKIQRGINRLRSKHLKSQTDLNYFQNRVGLFLK